MRLDKNILSAALISFGILLHAPAAFAAPTKKAPKERLEHARELLGKHYDRSVVKLGEKCADVTTQIRQWTQRAMKSHSPKVSRSVADAILAESKKHKLDPIFVTAVIQSESSFDPKAKGTSGEIGLMQLMPDTAEWIAKKYHLAWKGKKTLLDPVANIRIGTAYVEWLRSTFDNQSRLYLAAYNMGAKNVERALERNIWPKDYAKRVMKRYIDLYEKLDLKQKMDLKKPSAAKKVASRD